MAQDTLKYLGEDAREIAASIGKPAPYLWHISATGFVLLLKMWNY